MKNIVGEWNTTNHALLLTLNANVIRSSMTAMFIHAAYQLKTNAYNRIIFSYFKKKHVSEDTRVIGDQIIEWLAYNETDRKDDTDSDVIDTSDRYSFSSDTG
jgi:tRNA 2-selenouridine synthase SelU